MNAKEKKKISLTSVIAWIAIFILAFFLLFCGKDIISNENNKGVIIAVLLIAGILLLTISNLFSGHIESLLINMFNGFEEKIAKPARVFFIIFAFIFISVGINRWTEVMNSKNESRIEKIYDYVLNVQKDENVKNYGIKLKELETVLSTMAKNKKMFDSNPKELPE